MKKIIKVLVVLVILTTISVFAIGPLNVALFLVKPHHSFKDDIPAPKPDYSLAEYWLALPESQDLADLRPQGVEADSLLESVDVFFIHPTGYLKGAHWNSPLESESSTEENSKWMMANQASAFSDCAVYAPRYREATIYSFFDLDGHDEKAALDLAYSDVVASFDFYIKNHNKNRPFILASHSQGSYHAMSLLADRIDKSELADRLIAAYVIGMSTVTNDAVKEFQNILVCDSPDQINCLIHWATFADGNPQQDGWDTPMICVNPLTWKRDGGLADSKHHKGYLKSTGIYNLTF